MNNLEEALYINHNLKQQSQFHPASPTFDFVNRSKNFQNDTRVINAIQQDNTYECSQKVHN